MRATDCGEIRPSPEGVVCDGVLEGSSAEHSYWLVLREGQSLVASTLAPSWACPTWTLCSNSSTRGGTLSPSMMTL